MFLISPDLSGKNCSQRQPYQSHDYWSWILAGFLKKNWLAWGSEILWWIMYNAPKYHCCKWFIFLLPMNSKIWTWITYQMKWHFVDGVQSWPHGSRSNLHPEIMSLYAIVGCRQWLTYLVYSNVYDLFHPQCRPAVCILIVFYAIPCRFGHLFPHDFLFQTGSSGCLRKQGWQRIRNFSVNVLQLVNRDFKN